MQSAGDVDIIAVVLQLLKHNPSAVCKQCFTAYSSFSCFSTSVHFTKESGPEEGDRRTMSLTVKKNS